MQNPSECVYAANNSTRNATASQHGAPSDLFGLSADPIGMLAFLTVGYVPARPAHVEPSNTSADEKE